MQNTKTKQQFLSSPKRRTLPKKEQERRWKQYLFNSRNNNYERKRGYSRNTRMKISKSNKMQLKLSPCASEYLIALTAPFSHKGVACIPDLHAVPSKKIRVKTRGTFQTGTNGYGWIVANPWNTCNDRTIASYTINTFAGADPIADPAAPPAGVNNALAAKIPYANADFNGVNAKVKARVVGVGLRIRYIGPELARSGQIIGLRNPDNRTLVALSRAEFRSFETSKTFSNKKQWIYALYRPVEPNDYEYSPVSDRNSENASGFLSYSLGMYVTDTTDSTGSPGPAPFEWEIIQYVEYIGNIDNITRSHVDTQGMAHIRNSLPTKSVTDSMTKHVKKIASSLYDSIDSNSIVSAAAPAVGGALAYKNFFGPVIEEAEEAPTALETVLPLIEELSPLLLL